MLIYTHTYMLYKHTVIQILNYVVEIYCKFQHKAMLSIAANDVAQICGILFRPSEIGPNFVGLLYVRIQISDTLTQNQTDFVCTYNVVSRFSAVDVVALAMSVLE